MRNNLGVTLIELMVVLTIVAILAVALGFSYQGWMGNYKVESALKQLQADLMNARMQAMATNSPYVVDFPATTTYRVRTWNDANNDGKIDAAELAALPNTTFPKTLQYPVPAAVVGVLYTFDKRGLIYSGILAAAPALIDPAAPVTINLISPVSSGNTPDYDCVVMSQSRINIGLMNGAVCNAK